MTRPTRTAEERPFQQLLTDQMRAELGRQRMSHAELGRRARISEPTMLRISQCARDMSVDQWARISAALGFTPDELAAKATGGRW